MNCVISVIIPTLNEGRYLGATLERLVQNASQHEIIVSDGGSTDETIQIAAQHGATIITSALASAGRALQMNSGFHQSFQFLQLHHIFQLLNSMIRKRILTFLLWVETKIISAPEAILLNTEEIFRPRKLCMEIT